MATPQPKPLSGIRILVGRSRHQASVLASGLRELGAEVIEIPFIQIKNPKSFQPLDAALKNVKTYDWLILTSVNGVETTWERIRKLGIRFDRLSHLKIAAIGPATKKAIEQHGLKVHLVPKQYVAESVVKSLRSRVAGKRVLLARAKLARDVIPRELRKQGAQVDVVEAYQTVLPESSRRKLRALFEDPKRRPHVVTFTSSSTVRNFVALLAGQAAPASRTASIGPITSATLREFGLPVDIEAQEYTIPGLVEAIRAWRQ
jgi:uroporphyrinogen-III synthase